MPMTSPAFVYAPPPLHHRHHPPLNVSTARPSSSRIPPRTLRHTAPIRNPTKIISTPSAIKSSLDSTTIVDDPSVASSSGAAASASLHSEEDDDKAAAAKIGARVRVTVPLKVYHIPRVPEVDLTGREGVLKQYVAVWKGKRISANLPFKIEFVANNLEGRDGPVKFFAHLRADEFEFLD